MAYRLNEEQKSLLSSLLDRLENSSGGRMISIRVQPERFPAYFDDADPDRVRSWADSMDQLAALGWVGLDHGKGAESHRMIRVRLQTARALEVYRALERMELSEWRGQALELLRGPLERACEPLAWVEFLKGEKTRIENLAPPSSSRQEVLAELRVLYRALEKLVERAGTSSPWTWRQFAVTHFADSKKLDFLKPKIARILAGCIGLEGETDASVVLSYFGIQSKEEVFLLQGPVRLRVKGAQGGPLKGEEWTPFLALSATMADPDRSEWDFSGVEAVITIENEESFHSWCARNSKPRWLAIYLGGFPSREKVRFLERAAQEVGAFHHWGDLDCGGVAIFLFLEKKIGRAISSIGMEAPLLSQFAHATQPLSSSERERLKAILSGMPVGHGLASTVQAMLDQGRKLEQEAVLEPVS